MSCGVWDLFHKIKDQEHPTLWGTGRESRDFIYISDIVRIIELAITHSDFNGEMVNVANGKQITISEVAETVRQVSGTKTLISFNGAERKGDPINWEANIDIIKSWGYEPRVDLENGVKMYFEWLQELG